MCTILCNHFNKLYYSYTPISVFITTNYCNKTAVLHL